MRHFESCPAARDNTNYCTCVHIMGAAYGEVYCMTCHRYHGYPPCDLDSGAQRFDLLHLGSTSWHPDWPLIGMNGVAQSE